MMCQKALFFYTMQFESLFDGQLYYSIHSSQAKKTGNKNRAKWIKDKTVKGQNTML